MQYYYQIYGVTVISEIVLPALISNPADDSFSHPIYIKLGNVPEKLKNPEQGKTIFSIFNKHECITRIHDVADYYTTGGSEIIVEPLSSEMTKVVLFIYSTCFAVVMMQRNIFLMHVSGCFIGDREVLLLAAPSGTGKSTTAMMLKQNGYPTFTDDTALLHIENGQCYAWASYPETRMWKDAIEIQEVYDETEGERVLHRGEKFKFSFADSFITEKVTVKGIVFLEATGNKISVEKMAGAEIWQLLNENVYGLNFVDGMKNGKSLFIFLSTLANTLPSWKAIRPESGRSFDEFSAAVKEHIIQELI